MKKHMGMADLTLRVLLSSATFAAVLSDLCG
jgi:hypothetical protein